MYFLFGMHKSRLVIASYNGELLIVCIPLPRYTLTLTPFIYVADTAQNTRTLYYLLICNDTTLRPERECLKKLTENVRIQPCVTHCGAQICHGRGAPGE